jgi:hypothetical protein
MPSVQRISDDSEGRANKRGCLRIRLASAFCLCLATHCGRVAECHSPHAAISAVCHFPLPRPPTKERLLYATPQLRFPASTFQALSVSELRKRSSCASTLDGSFFPELLWCSGLYRPSFHFATIAPPDRSSRQETNNSASCDGRQNSGNWVFIEACLTCKITNVLIQPEKNSRIPLVPYGKNHLSSG